MTTIEQLLQARNNCVTTIAALKEAGRDGVDRSGSIASIERDLGSYERQLKARDYVEPVAAPAEPVAAPEPPKKHAKPHHK